LLKSFCINRRSDLGLTSYLLSNAIILPATNWLGQVSAVNDSHWLHYFVTIASALCGIAGSLGLLIIARVIQGAAGGALMPISQAVLMESFPLAKRGVAMAVFTMGNCGRANSGADNRWLANLQLLPGAGPS